MPKRKSKESSEHQIDVKRILAEGKILLEKRELQERANEQSYREGISEVMKTHFHVCGRNCGRGSR